MYTPCSVAGRVSATGTVLVSIGVILEEETSVTLVVLQLQLGVFVTYGQLDLLMLALGVHAHIIFGLHIVRLHLNVILAYSNCT